jgi:ABC-type multidrug transport system ATPase subunit
MSFKSNPPERRSDDWWKNCDERHAEFRTTDYECARSVWDMDACGGDAMMLVLTFVGYLALIIIWDNLMQNPGFRKKLDPQINHAACSSEMMLEDDDVQDEKAKVSKMDPSDPSLSVYIRGVHKIYNIGGVVRIKNTGPSKIHAVKGANLTLLKGEVFGLLGVNGAGKSTLFKTLAADIIPTEGTVYVAGHSLQTAKGVRLARESIGYCPQENAQLDLLTVKESLELFGRVKGIGKADLENAVQQKISQMDLMLHFTKRAFNLSGGNRRKLMVAMAMMREPPLIFLDEPSAGMDPMARRFMWTVIQNIASTRKKSSVVLTTHSREECEALCTRTVIMVNGVFRCLGSHTHIKEKYGQGYSLMVKTRNPTPEQIAALLEEWGMQNEKTDKRVTLKFLRDMVRGKGEEWIANSMDSSAAPFERMALAANMNEAAKKEAILRWEASQSTGLRVAANFVIISRSMQALTKMLHAELPNTCWIEWHGQSASFQVPRETLEMKQWGLGPVFGLFESKKAELGIEEYAVSQTTLEEVFARFARDQVSTDGPVSPGGATGGQVDPSTKILQALFDSWAHVQVQAQPQVIGVAPAAEAGVTVEGANPTSETE